MYLKYVGVQSWMTAAIANFRNSSGTEGEAAEAKKREKKNGKLIAATAGNRTRKLGITAITEFRPNPIQLCYEKTKGSTERGIGFSNRFPSSSHTALLEKKSAFSQARYTDSVARIGIMSGKSLFS